MRQRTVTLHGMATKCSFLALFSFCMVSQSPETQAANVLFVADLDDANDEIGNESVVDRLMDLGHDVEIVDDNDSFGFDASGNELIVITSSSLSTNIGDWFTEEPIPIINWENALTDELLFSDGGQTSDADSIDVIDIGHPLAGIMGLNETTEVVVRDVDTTSFHLVDPANLAPGGIVIAEEPFSGGVAIFVIDEGGELVDGSEAAATRINLFYGDRSLDGVNDAGVAIFDGAVSYALGGDMGPSDLQPGDADQDLDFDQLDIVRVSIAAKYLTGQPATWGEGDWNGAPGGQQGSPPPGNGFFDQLDIISALSAGKYLTGPYAAVQTGGVVDDEQTSLVYDTATGELSVDAPASTQLTSIFVTSASDAFIGEKPSVLDGPFDSFGADNIFKSTIGSSFGDISLGNVLPAGLSEADVAADLTASGSLDGGGGLGDVDLVWIPEPATLVLLMVGTSVLAIATGRRDH